MSGNSPIQQTGIGLEKETILRADRLRFCYGKSRSHVIQLALDGAGLAGLEKIKAEDVARFDALAADQGYGDWREFTAHLVEIYGAKTYPPTLDVLEGHAAVDHSRKPRAVVQSRLLDQLVRVRDNQHASEQTQTDVITMNTESSIPDLKPARVLSLRDLKQ